MKRKLVCLALIGVMAMGLFAACGPTQEERENNLLRIYNWEDYIGEGVIDDFKEYYNNKYGTTLNVEYNTFDTNETMLTKVEKGKEDYDLVCPSDYIIQYMITQGLAQPIKTQNLENFASYSPYIKSKHEEFEKMAKSEDDSATYSVSYMWGTMGILYNPEKTGLTDKDVREQGWSLLWDSTFRRKVLMKDSVRDTYTIAAIYANRDELEKAKDESPSTFTAKLTEVINDTGEEAVKKVEDALKAQKDVVNPYFEVDDGKGKMVNEEALLQVAWSGDAIWAIQEAAAKQNPVELRYVVPELGSNLWFDGWVIPKYAKNEKAAMEFIDFMLRPDVAKRNMVEIGYTSGVFNDDIATWLGQRPETDDDIAIAGDREDVDLGYLLGGESKTVSAPEYMYPDSGMIANLAVMANFGDSTTAVMDMWARVKTNTLAIVLIVVLSVVAAAGIATVLILYFRSRNKKNKNTPNKPNPTKSKGYRPPPAN